MRVDMTPEDQLCLLLARGQLSLGARSRALELLATPLRWNLLLARAGAHEVTPLVYRNLATLEFSGVPDPVRAEFVNVGLIVGSDESSEWQLRAGCAR